MNHLALSLIIGLQLLACGSDESTIQPNDSERDTEGYPLNVDSDGLAIKGYDPVAYQVDGESALGSEEFIHEYQGATYRFLNEEHLNLFKEDPETYVPMYGGYCAYAMAVDSSLVLVDPKNAWTIVDDRLYLNYDTSVKSKFDKKKSDYITKADKNWSAHKQ